MLLLNYLIVLMLLYELIILMHQFFDLLNHDSVCHKPNDRIVAVVQRFPFLVVFLDAVLELVETLRMWRTVHRGFGTHVQLRVKVVSQKFGQITLANDRRQFERHDVVVSLWVTVNVVDDTI